MFRFLAPYYGYNTVDVWKSKLVQEGRLSNIVLRSKKEMRFQLRIMQCKVCCVYVTFKTEKVLAIPGLVMELLALDMTTTRRVSWACKVRVSRNNNALCNASLVVAVIGSCATRAPFS